MLQCAHDIMCPLASDLKHEPYMINFHSCEIEIGTPANKTKPSLYMHCLYIYLSLSLSLALLRMYICNYIYIYVFVDMCD